MVSIVIQGEKKSDFDILITLAKRLGLTVQEETIEEKVVTPFSTSLEECKKGKTNKYNSPKELREKLSV